MKTIRPALAITAGALTLAIAMLVGPASAVAAPNVVGAIASVQGKEPLGQNVSMPLGTSFNSATGSGARGSIFHESTGVYRLFFNNMVPKDPNALNTDVVDLGGAFQVRVRSADGTCHAPSETVAQKASGGLPALVECWDHAGNKADRPFTISYTHGGTQTGSLITAHMNDGSGLPLNQKVQLKGESSVNASTPSPTLSGVTVIKTGIGRYTFQMFAGTGPSTFQVTPSLSRFQPGAVCGIAGTSVSNGVKSVNVGCRGPLDKGLVDVGLYLSYAHGINLLGLTALSSAYLSMPLTTAFETSVQPADMFNTINGFTGGGAIVLRFSAGRYEVRLNNQQLHVGAETFGVTPEGSSANCLIPFSEPEFGYQRLQVNCNNSNNTAVDTAFQLHYAGQQ